MARAIENLKQMVAEQTAVLALGFLAARHFHAAIASLARPCVTDQVKKTEAA